MALSADTKSVEADAPAEFCGKLEWVCVPAVVTHAQQIPVAYNGEVIHG